MRSLAQGQLRFSYSMDPFAGMRSDLGQAEGSSPARVKEKENGGWGGILGIITMILVSIECLLCARHCVTNQ